MAETIITDLHCHSNLSDGTLNPEELAGLLAVQGVTLAALTDHNTFAGCKRFGQALKQLGITAITGMELSLPAKTLPEIHLLVYGFDTEHKGIRELARDAAAYRLTAIPKKYPSGHHPAGGIFEIIHRAGGLVFLAHPYLYYRDPAECENLVLELKNVGMDGLECYYKSYTGGQITSLIKLAEKYDLFMSGGSDFHSRENKEDRVEYPSVFRPLHHAVPGIGIPASHLRHFIPLY
jgi:predicted metal-dependent phosphoesterase TrpH